MTDDDRKNAREYAWRYFALHAEQRMRLFNFFLILSGLILGAFPAVQSITGGGRIVLMLPALLVLAAFVFWRLEERTRQLVKSAEDALRFLDAERQLEKLPDGAPHWLELFERDDRLMSARRNAWQRALLPLSYADCFRATYLMIGGTGVALTAWIGLR